MRLVIQRVKSAKLSVDNKLVSEIGAGLLVFVGVCDGDTEETVNKAVDKVANLRIFEQDDKMTLSVMDVKGEILAVSNFTLCTSEGKGHRPYFGESAERSVALDLYEKFAGKLDEMGVPTRCGIFGAHMDINAELDGPVNIYKEIK